MWSRYYKRVVDSQALQLHVRVLCQMRKYEMVLDGFYTILSAGNVI